jgi:hypothetical protein
LTLPPRPSSRLPRRLCLSILPRSLAPLLPVRLLLLALCSPSPRLACCPCLPFLPYQRSACPYLCVSSRCCQPHQCLTRHVPNVPCAQSCHRHPRLSLTNSRRLCLCHSPPHRLNRPKPPKPNLRATEHKIKQTPRK